MRITSGCALTPGTARCDLAQHRVERGPDFPFTEWVNPDEHTIDRQELLADLVGKILVINRGLGVDAECRELLEDTVIAIVLRGRGLSRLAIAGPQNRNAEGFGIRHLNALLAGREAQSLDG